MVDIILAQAVVDMYAYVRNIPDTGKAGLESTQRE